jgi:hypothetical protein
MLPAWVVLAIADLGTAAGEEEDGTVVCAVAAVEGTAVAEEEEWVEEGAAAFLCLGAIFPGLGVRSPRCVALGYRGRGNWAVVRGIGCCCA